MTKVDTNGAEESKLSSFVSHLVELRDRLLRMVISVGVVFIVLAPFAKHIYAIFALPLTDTGVQMQSIAPAAPLLIPYKLTLMVAFLIAIPYVFYQAWQFIAPGLYKHEKRIAVPMITSSVGLFYLGVLFAYFVLLKMMFTVIPLFLPEAVIYQPDIGEYLDFVMMMFIAFGFCFEMPIATILLISTGVTTAEKLATKRPYVIVGAFVVGMILTPPDVISQILLAIPMWLLFELGLFLSKFFNQRITDAGNARRDRDEQEDEADIESLESHDQSSEHSPAVTASAGAVAATSIADQADALRSVEDETSSEYNNADEAQAYEAFENYHPRSDDALETEQEVTEEALAEKKATDDNTTSDTMPATPQESTSDASSHSDQPTPSSSDHSSND